MSESGRFNIICMFINAIAESAMLYVYLRHYIVINVWNET